MYAGNALSEPVTSTVVYPTGVYPDDPAAVQQAVDGGGTVVLESVNIAGDPTAFNFGPPGLFEATFLTTDVEILGVEGAAKTRIEGGFIPFLGDQHTTTRIENITFDGPEFTAALFVNSTGVEFIGNHVTGVVGWSGGGVTEGRGITILGNDDPAGAIVGNIEIIGNRFDNLHADLSDAIVLDAVAAHTYIAHNEILDIGGSGIVVISQSGDVEVTRNTIIPGPGPDTEWDFGDGITIVGGSGHFAITRNTILCENLIANPIWLLGNDSLFPIPFGRIDAPVITRNVINKIGPSFGGSINIWGDVDNAYVANNRVSGSSEYAIGIFPWFGGESAQGNTMLGNNIIRYEASRFNTVVWFHASDTHVIGNAGSVLDLGQNTVITGEGPVGGAFAGGFSQAHEAAALKSVGRFLRDNRP